MNRVHYTLTASFTTARFFPLLKYVNLPDRENLRFRRASMINTIKKSTILFISIRENIRTKFLTYLSVTTFVKFYVRRNIKII